MEVKQSSVNNLEIMHKDKLLPLTKQKAALAAQPLHIFQTIVRKMVDKWQNRNGTIITYYLASENWGWQYTTIMYT